MRSVRVLMQTSEAQILDLGTAEESIAEVQTMQAVDLGTAGFWCHHVNEG